MSKSISRAQFIRGDFSGIRSHIRPPWAKGEREFVGNCSRCEACITACPENIITKDPKGFPTLSFRHGECTFCAECVKACEAGVFESDTSSAAWSLAANIGTKCLPLQGVVCGRCAEECELEAISMRLVAGGISIPRLNTESCNGCGACYRNCPTTAIEFSYLGATT